MEPTPSPEEQPFAADARAAVYQAIFSRRDVRGQFLPEPIDDTVLARILMAAHHAPSVGFMQPWNFLLIRDHQVRSRVHALFAQANEEARQRFSGERRERYSRFKLEGILQAPLGLCITCDRERSGPVVIGRTHIAAMDLYSSVCAVQNLWLAARAEGLGVGWVSIFDEKKLQQVLGIPERIVPIAYLCIGKVSHFHEKPELEKAGWLPRLAVEELIYQDQWGQPADAADPLLDKLRTMRLEAADGHWPR